MTLAVTQRDRSVLAISGSAPVDDQSCFRQTTSLEHHPLGHIDHVGPRAIREALKVVRTTGSLVEQDAGLVARLKFHVVAHHRGDGDPRYA
jgi:hypothetical protein